MEDDTVSLVEEAQQFGGLDEVVVVVAELFCDSLVVYGGDRHQTPGGISAQDTTAVASCRRLMQRQHGEV